MKRTNDAPNTVSRKLGDRAERLNLTATHTPLPLSPPPPLSLSPSLKTHPPRPKKTTTQPQTTQALYIASPHGFPQNPVRLLVILQEVRRFSPSRNAAKLRIRSCCGRQSPVSSLPTFSISNLLIVILCVGELRCYGPVYESRSTNSRLYTQHTGPLYLLDPSESQETRLPP